MKKYCVFILIIASLLSMCVPVAFSETENYAQFEYEVLKQLNIATGEVIYEPDKLLARKDFAILAARLRGYDGNECTESAFIDIDKEHYAAGSIMYLYNMGVISGYDDNTFRGEEAVTYAQAVAVLENLLGYNEVVQIRGGWTKGVTRVASDIDLNKGLRSSAENALTQADAMKLLYNALDTKLCDNDLKSVEIANGEIAMDEWLSLAKIKGVVRTVGNLTTTNYTTGPNIMTVGTEKLSIDGNNYEDCLGKYCEVYYRKDHESVAAAVVISGRNDITEIKTEDVESFDGNTLTYNVGNSKKRITIGAGDDISLNGEFVPSDQRIKSILESNGKITINEMNDEKIIMIESFDIVFVTNVNRSDSIIYGKFGKKLELDDVDNLVIYDESGKETDFTSIVPDDVLTVKQNSDSTAVNIRISKNKTEGIYNGFETNGDFYTINGTQYPIKYYRIDTESYRLTPDMVKNEPVISIGSKVTAYLDSFGRIANTDLSEDSYNYGYVCKVSQDEDAEPDEVLIKLYTTNDEFVKLYANKKVRIDDESAEGYEDIVAKLDRGTGHNDIYQLVRYTINNDNKINKIDTLYKGKNESENSLHTIFQGYSAAKTELQKLVWKPRGGSFESKVLYDTSLTKYMTVPRDITGDPKMFIIGKSLSEDDQVCFNAYASTEDQLMPDVLLAYIDNSGGNVEERISETRFGIITEMKTQVNEDNEIETVITLDTYGGVKTYITDEDFDVNRIMPYSSGKKVKDACKEYNTDGFDYSTDAPYKLSEGDFVELTLDTKNNVIFTRMIVSARDGSCVMDKADAGSVYNNRFVFGPMYKIDGSRFSVAAKLGSEEITYNILRYYNTGSARYYRVKKMQKKIGVEKISKDDIIDYKSSGDNAENVLVYSSAGMTQIVAAYEK